MAVRHPLVFVGCLLRGERLTCTRPCRDKHVSAKRDAPGQDTGMSQGPLRSYLQGGASGQRRRAGFETGCTTIYERHLMNVCVRCRHERQLMNLRNLIRVMQGDSAGPSGSGRAPASERPPKRGKVSQCGPCQADMLCVVLSLCASCFNT
jgi:hypothetical protein